MTTIPAYSFGGITRPELFLDAAGNVVLTPAAQAFTATYGLKALYAGVPAGTPWPPVAASLSAPTDGNAAANGIAEGAAANTLVNITASANSSSGLPVVYSLTGDTSGGGFKIDATTGIVTVADPTKINFESAPGHAYSVTVLANDSVLTSSQTFSIAVSDVAPATPSDANAAANSVAEGAAVGTLVGVTVQTSDVNGGAITYSLSNNANGAFKIDAATGVVSVADPTKLDYESSGPGHSYSITAVASDGTLTSSHSFTIAVTDVALSTPVDSNAAANSVAEGAANGSTVGVTASAVDPNGPATTYSLIGGNIGGAFTIDPTTGVITVADGTKLDFETSSSYTLVVQASNGVQTSSQSFVIAVTDVAPSTPVDSAAAANIVAEGAANGSAVGIIASSSDINGPAVTYSLISDTSGGGFTINAATGVISVADSTRIDYESAAGHAYTVTAQASDGTLASSQTFTIGVTDVAPSIPADSNAAANLVAEDAAVGSTVGITASSTDVNGPAVTYSLTGDTSGGAFTINATTGVVTVADPSRVNYETAPGHAYTITAQASDGTLTSSQTFTIGVTDVAPFTPLDSDVAANTVAEGAANGSSVGVTAASADINGPAVTYSLIGDTSGGGFTINATTGVITVADSTRLDFETSGGSYTVIAQASDGTLANSQSFVIAVTDVAPAAPVDSNATANAIAEGAANGSTVGITVSSTDVNGPAVTYSLTADSSGGGFTINAATGVITVADSTKIDYESAPGHVYTVTAQASDGTLASSQTFTIGVTDVAPSTPVDNNGGANTVAEGAAVGSTVGVTVSSTDVNGPAVTYSLTGDSSGGGFTINAATGVITVADSTKIDYESAAGHAYTVTAQASDGTLTSSQTFTIGVSDTAPAVPADANAAINTIAEGAANGSTVGVTAASTDVNGPAVTYSLIGDTSGGGFTINATTGVVTVADSTKIDFETSGGSYTVTAQASDGTFASSHAFVIAVTDVAPSTPVDSNAAANQVSTGAPVGTQTGVIASSTDVNGPAVTYSLVGDTSGGGFTVNAATGVVTVADSSKVIYAGSPTNFDVTVDASDGTLHSQQTFTIAVVPNTAPVANDDATSATEAGGLNNAVAGSNPSGNVILGTGGHGEVTDTDAEDLSNALSVVAVHTGAEGSSLATGTVGLALAGAHGSLTLNSNGTYTYNVDQSDAAVQALHGSADTITDTFNYTVQDSGGLQDTATLTVTIHGANDLPSAVADAGSMTEDASPTQFDVIANDVQDPDSTAPHPNTITVGPGGVTVTGPAGETFANSDAQAAIVGNKIQVTLTNSAFQQLAVGEHATVTVPYTLTGDAGETSTANLVVTVNGVNDVPVATDDSGSMTEDQSGHAFTVLSNDMLDADHGAANSVTTTSTITNLSAPSGRNIDVSDISVSVNGSNQLVVNLGADLQRLKTGETATFDVDYTLHGDQPGDTSTATLHVTVNGVTDALDITPNSPSAASYTENAAATALLSGGTISSGDGDLTSGSYTVAVTANASAGDQIVLLGSSSFAVNGSSLLYAGNVVGTISGLGTSSVSIGSLTSYATSTAINAMATAFGFQNSTENPSTSARTVSFTFNDGASSDTVTQTVNVTAVNDAPVNTVPGAMLSTNQNTDLAITGLSVSDVDSAGASETTTLHVGNGTLTVLSAGGASVSGSGTATVILTGTIAQINTTLAAASNVVYHPTTGATGADSLTVTTNDGGHSPTGALSDVDTVSLYVNPPAVSGQLWYLGQGNPTDARVAYMNINAANGSNTNGTTTVLVDNNPTTDLVTASPADIQVDWAAGIYYVLSNSSVGDNGVVLMGQIGSSAAPTAVFTPPAADIINTIQIDPVTHHLYVGTTEGTSAAPASTGIRDFTYNTTTGALTAVSTNGGFLLKSNQQSAIPNYSGLAGPLFITTDFTYDATTNKLFWINQAYGSAYANEAYWLDLSDPTNVHTLLQQSQFPYGSTDAAWTNGFLHSIEVDPSTTTVYFTTYSQHPSPDSQYNAALNKIYYINESATGSTAAVALTITGLPGGNKFYPGQMTFDPTTRQLYVVSEETDTGGVTNNDVIYVLQLSADGHSASLVNTISATNPVFTQDSANFGSMTFEALPVLSVANSTFTEGTPAALAPTLTITDTGNIKGATVNTYGGFTGDGDTLTFSTAGTSIVGNLTSANGNLTLTFTGTDTVAHYQQVLRTVTFSSGENPTNYGDTNTTRSIVWHLDDGVLGNLYGTTNTKTTTLTITDLNDAPVIDLDGSSGGTSYTTSYTANGPFVAIADSDDSVSDVDSQTLASATIILTDAKAGDVLAISGALPTGISATITPGSGIITVALSGSASAASYQAALHQVVFANSGSTADTSDRHFSVTVSDGTSASAAATTTVHVSSPLLASEDGVASTSHTPGELHLTQAQLNSVVDAAIAQWAAAGASESQLAKMHATTFSVADLAGDIVGEESSPAHITIDVNAAGHGWFIDSTPSDGFEFAHDVSAAGTDLYTDPSSAAAGHLDLLTAVSHELGHVIGLPDTAASNAAHDIMYLYLADGERRLPNTTDIPATAATPATHPVSNFQFGDAPSAISFFGQMFDGAAIAALLKFMGVGPSQLHDPALPDSHVVTAQEQHHFGWLV